MTLAKPALFTLSAALPPQKSGEARRVKPPNTRRIRHPKTPAGRVLYANHPLCPVFFTGNLLFF